MQQAMQPIQIQGALTSCHSELQLFLSFVFPCSCCYKFFRLQPKKAKGGLARQDPDGYATTFETSKGTEHLRNVHKLSTKRMYGVMADKAIATAEAAVPAKRLRELQKKLDVDEPLAPTSTQKPSAKPSAVAPQKDWFKPTPNQVAKKRRAKHARQRAKQARFCAYSDCKVTGTMFESPEYREVSFSFLFLLS